MRQMNTHFFKKMDQWTVLWWWIKVEHLASKSSRNMTAAGLCALSIDIVYNTWKPKSKQPKCIFSRFLWFLSCCQDLERLNQEESLSVMDCAGGWSGHRHARCTLEDRALLSVLGTATARAQHDGPSHAAFSATLQVINAQRSIWQKAKKFPQAKQAEGHGGFFLVSFSS